jgi:hypothetical protein
VPSKDGFTFSNDWPRGPAITVPAPMRPIGSGNAAAGLCGGMVFAALDYWHAGLAPPRARPASGSPLYRFIVRRLCRSVPQHPDRAVPWRRRLRRRAGHPHLRAPIAASRV